MNKKLKILTFFISVFIIIFILMNIKNYKINNILNDNEYIPKHYINELYSSKEINYKMNLDKKERKIYDELINRIINFESEFTISLSEYDYSYPYLYLDKISKIVYAIGMDHPELIQLGRISSSIDRSGNSKNVLINCGYVISKEEYLDKIEEITVIIEDIKNNTSNLDEYSKIKYVYDYIGKNNVYGDPNDPMGQSAYSAFNTNLSPVCAGYAKASQIIFYNIGIKSVLVFGDSNYALFLGRPHAWNHVSIDGKFYLYDVTLSGSINKENNFYSGFLIKDKSKHTPWNKKSTPRLNGYKYAK